MDLDREQLIEIGLSIGAAGMMIVVLLAIGSTYATDEELSTTGGIALVGSIVFFVLLMAAVGYGLAFTVSADDGPDGEPTAADGNGDAANERP